MAFPEDIYEYATSVVTYLSPADLTIRPPSEIHDSFDRANNAALVAAETGQAWTNIVNGFNINANNAVINTNNAANLVSIATASAHVYAEAIVKKVAIGVGDGASSGPSVRNTGGSNIWLRLYQNQVQIVQNAAGAFTNILNITDGGLAVGALVRLGLWAVNGTFVAFVNLAPVGGAFSSINLGVTDHGMWGEDVSSTVDSFRMWSLDNLGTPI